MMVCGEGCGPNPGLPTCRAARLAADALPPASVAPPRGPVLLRPRGEAPAPLVFRRGAHAPFAVRWYGITSLFGHLRHFIASAIASEQVDSRDWMHPDTPAELVARVA